MHPTHLRTAERKPFTIAAVFFVFRKFIISCRLQSLIRNPSIWFVVCQFDIEELGVGGALRRLREFLVGGVGHISSKLNQNRLHSIIPTPVCEARQLGRIDYAVSWVDAGKVDFIDELDGGWLIGVLISAMHLEGVDSVLMNAVGRTKNCAIPV